MNASDLGPLERHLRSLPKAERRDPAHPARTWWFAWSSRGFSARNGRCAGNAGSDDRRLHHVSARRPASVAQHGRELRSRPRRAGRVRRRAQADRSRRSAGATSRRSSRQPDDAGPVAALGRPRRRLRARVLPVPGARAEARREPGGRPAGAARLARAAEVPRSSTRSIDCWRSPMRRHRAGCATRRLLEVLYASGMRVSELVAVKPGDLNLDEGYLTCIGKGDKQRMVPMGRSAADWFRRYMHEGGRRLLRKRSSPWLFVNARDGGPLSRVGFWKVLKAYGVRGGHHARDQPARAAAFVRDAPARARRRPARDSDHARTRRSVDHADLHARAGSEAAGGLRSVPSEAVRRGSASLNLPGPTRFIVK